MPEKKNIHTYIKYTAEKKRHTLHNDGVVDGHGLAGTELAEGRRCQRRRIYTHI